jgi:hypothetical protein
VAGAGRHPPVAAPRRLPGRGPSPLGRRRGRRRPRQPAQLTCAGQQGDGSAGAHSRAGGSRSACWGQRGRARYGAVGDRRDLTECPCWTAPRGVVGIGDGAAS